MDFNYETAFNRNLGWVTNQEQNVIRKKKIAIGGLGGVGGSYLIALGRLGFENFSLSDLDSFDLSNFNRQFGANTSTLGKSKLEVMSKMVTEINPNICCDLFPNGLNLSNYVEFLKGADLYLDSLDLYATPLRRKIFTYCYEHGIPIVTAAPIGMSSSLLVFTPDGMSPDEYFGAKENEPLEKQIIRFLVGVNPKMKALKNLIQEDGVGLQQKKIPSLVLGIEMCTAVACSAILKILLKRGPVKTAPYSCHFDAFTNEQYYVKRPFGFRNPFQRIMFYVLCRRFLKK